MKKRVHKCKCPNNNLLIVALILLVLFLLMETFIRTYNLYETAPFLDIPSHFFGGMALAGLSYWFLSVTSFKFKKTGTIALTFVGSLIWELLEKIQEALIENPPYLVDIFYWDGVLDVTVTLLGGFVAIGVISYLKKKKRI